LIRLREIQERALKELVDGMDSYSVFSLQMPTGSGKTLIGLMFRYSYGYRVLASVRTRNQLMPYVRDSVKFFSSIPSIHLNKGRVCLHMSTEDTELIRCSSCPNRLITVSALPGIAEKARSLLVRAVRETGINDPYVLVERLWSGKDPSTAVCPYQLFNFLDGSMLVCTYPFLIYPYLRVHLIRYRPEVLIVDEAHNLEDSFKTAWRSITYDAIARAREELREYESATGDPADEAHELLNLVESWFLGVSRRYGHVEEKVIGTEEYPEVVTDRGYGSLLEAYSSVVGRVVRYKKSRYRRRRVRFFNYRILAFLDLLSKVYRGDEDLVLVLDKGRAELRRYRLRSLFSQLFGPFEGSKVILMSGTMPSKNYLVRVWGVPSEELKVIDLGTRFGRFRCRFEHGVSSKYEYRGDGMYSKYASLVEKVYSGAAKSVLAVAPSYEFAREVGRRLFGSVRLVVEGEGTRVGDVYDRIRSGKRLIIAVAGGKLTEGVEWVDESGRSLISDVVVMGIPFPKPTEYEKLIRESMGEGLDSTVGYLYMRERAWILIRQAIGRAIRSGEEECGVWFMDWRYRDPWWMSKIAELGG